MYRPFRAVVLTACAAVHTFTAFATPSAAEARTSAHRFPTACEAPFHAELGERIRRTESLVGERHCYQLDLPTSGLVRFALRADAANARLDFFAEDGERQTASRLHRTRGEQLHLLEAGTYFVEVSALDPRRALAAYRFESATSTLDHSETDGEIEIEPEETIKSETDGEIEIEPEETIKSETDGEIEIEPEETIKSETDGEIEIEPEETIKSETDGEIEIEPEETIKSQLARLCSGSSHDDSSDDHGDSPLCATDMSRSAHGELGNAWNDDTDTFRFELGRWQTLELLGLVSEGETAAFRTTLTDDRGQTLASWSGQDSTDTVAFRSLRELAPGTYYLQIEGAAGTHYSLRLREIR